MNELKNLDIEMWLARDKDGVICLYLTEPVLSDDGDCFISGINDIGYHGTMLTLPGRFYPEITFENSPVRLTNIKP